MRIATLLMFMDTLHIILCPIETAMFRLIHHLKPKAFPEGLLHHELVVTRAHIDLYSGWRGMAEGEVCAEAIGKLHFEIEVQLDLQLLHIGVLVVIGVHAERLLPLKPLQLDVPSAFL